MEYPKGVYWGILCAPYITKSTMTHAHSIARIRDLFLLTKALHNFFQQSVNGRFMLYGRQQKGDEINQRFDWDQWYILHHPQWWLFPKLLLHQYFCCKNAILVIILIKKSCKISSMSCSLNRIEIFKTVLISFIHLILCLSCTWYNINRVW